MPAAAQSPPGQQIVLSWICLAQLANQHSSDYLESGLCAGVYGRQHHPGGGVGLQVPGSVDVCQQQRCDGSCPEPQEITPAMGPTLPPPDQEACQPACDGPLLQGHGPGGAAVRRRDLESHATSPANATQFPSPLRPLPRSDDNHPAGEW